MTKVLIEVPDNLHRLVKTVASSKGETMKDFIIRAIQELVRQETKTASLDDLSELFVSKIATQNLDLPNNVSDLT